ncbi:hypothetical protein LCGC14_1466960, partial [marine sediment metagenome]
MPAVSRALSELAQTLGERGGIGEARIRGATAALGLRKAEYDIERNRAEDVRRQTEFEERSAIRAPQVEQAEALSRQVPIYQDMFRPQTATGIIHFETPNKTGVSPRDISEKGLIGSTWVKDSEGRSVRADKDGNIVTVSQQQLNRIKERATGASIAMLDPEYFLQDQDLEAAMKQERLDMNDPEDADIYGQLQGQRDQIKAALAAPKKMAEIRLNKIIKSVQFISSLYADPSSNPQFIKFVEGELKRDR